MNPRRRGPFPQGQRTYYHIGLRALQRLIPSVFGTHYGRLPFIPLWYDFVTDTDYYSGIKNTKTALLGGLLSYYYSGPQEEQQEEFHKTENMELDIIEESGTDYLVPTEEETSFLDDDEFDFSEYETSNYQYSGDYGETDGLVNSGFYTDYDESVMKEELLKAHRAFFRRLDKTLADSDDLDYEETNTLKGKIQHRFRKVWRDFRAPKQRLDEYGYDIDFKKALDDANAEDILQVKRYIRAKEEELDAEVERNELRRENLRNQRNYRKRLRIEEPQKYRRLFRNPLQRYFDEIGDDVATIRRNIKSKGAKYWYQKLRDTLSEEGRDIKKEIKLQKKIKQKSASAPTNTRKYKFAGKKIYITRSPIPGLLPGAEHVVGSHRFQTTAYQDVTSKTACNPYAMTNAEYAECMKRNREIREWEAYERSRKEFEKYHRHIIEADKERQLAIARALKRIIINRLLEKNKSRVVSIPDPKMPDQRLYERGHTLVPKTGIFEYEYTLKIPNSDISDYRYQHLVVDEQNGIELNYHPMLWKCFDNDNNVDLFQSYYSSCPGNNISKYWYNMKLMTVMSVTFSYQKEYRSSIPGNANMSLNPASYFLDNISPSGCITFAYHTRILQQ